jgi:predicted nucleic acid-binding protein
LTLVLDSNVVMLACAAVDGFARFPAEDLVAPPLMWSEFQSGLHEAQWRGAISPALARTTLQRLASAPIHRRPHPRLGQEAWRIADLLGWAKTYDAEYVALAQLLSATLVTLDRRLRRGADRLGFVIGLDEL